jgi:hypothetical protein
MGWEDQPIVQAAQGRWENQPIVQQAPQAPVQAPQASPASSERIGGPWGSVLDYFDLQKQAQAPEQRSFGAKALTAAGTTAEGFVPHSIEQAAQLAEYPVKMANPVFSNAQRVYDYMQGKPALEAATQDVPVAQRIPQYLNAPDSQGRFNAVAGGLADASMFAPVLFHGAEVPNVDAAVRESMATEAPVPQKQAPEAAPRVEAAEPQPEAANARLQPATEPATIPTPDELTRQVAASPEAATPGDIAPGQQPAIPPEDARYAGMGQPAPETSGGAGGLGTTGVSRAARDLSGEVDVTPAEVFSAEDHIQNGRQLESQGADTNGIVGDAVQRGSFGRPAIDLAVTRDADLTEAARRAGREARANPGNPELQRVADQATAAQQQWEDYAIRPIRGQFADTGRSLQTAIDLDTGDFVDYLKAFRKEKGVEPQPQVAQALKQASDVVSNIRDTNQQFMQDWERELNKTVKPRKTFRNMDELKKSLDDLKEQLFKDCP